MRLKSEATVLPKKECVAIIASVVLAACVLPEQGGSIVAETHSNSMPGSGGTSQLAIGGALGQGAMTSDSTGSSVATAGSTSDDSPIAANTATTVTGGTSAIIVSVVGGTSGGSGTISSLTFATGGNAVVGGAPSSSLNTLGGSIGVAGGGSDCSGELAGSTSSCTCKGTCAGAGTQTLCSSGYVDGNGACAIVSVAGCDITYEVEPDYCDGTNQAYCLFALPPFKLLTFGVYFPNDVQIESLGAVIGEASTTFQVALYDDANGRPGKPVLATSETLTYAMPLQKFEQLVPIKAGEYWLAILAGAGNESVYFVADNESVGRMVLYDWTNETTWQSGSDWAARLIQYTPEGGLFAAIGPHVYATYFSATARPQQ